MVVLFKKCLQGLLMALGIIKDAECTVRIQKHLNIAVIPQKPHERKTKHKADRPNEEGHHQYSSFHNL